MVLYGNTQNRIGDGFSWTIDVTMSNGLIAGRIHGSLFHLSQETSRRSIFVEPQKTGCSKISQAYPLVEFNGGYNNIMHTFP